ncbi:hypothetical protein Tco_1493930 [Tanacetum coccineum]
MRGRDRQKSCADNRRKPLEFEVGERVMLKVSPWKGVIRFGKKGKLALRYVGPFEILERISPVAYRLRLPEEVSGVHDTFHVSNLKKCLADASLHVPLDEIKVDKTLHFVEEPVENSDREVKRLKCSSFGGRLGPVLTRERSEVFRTSGLANLQEFSSMCLLEIPQRRASDLESKCTFSRREEGKLSSRSLLVFPSSRKRMKPGEKEMNTLLRNEASCFSTAKFEKVQKDAKTSHELGYGFRSNVPGHQANLIEDIALERDTKALPKIEREAIPV